VDPLSFQNHAYHCCSGRDAIIAIELSSWQSGKPVLIVNPTSSTSMKTVVFTGLVLLLSILMTSCSNYPEAPVLTLTSVEGTIIELNANTPMTAVFFFSMGNPVALGAFNRLPENLDDAVDSVAIAMYVDRPPNVYNIQQRTLVPVVIDEAGHIASAFGGIDLTPTLILIDKGRILLHQRGQLDYEAVNAIINRQ
jgi:hypothetical protein